MAPALLGFLFANLLEKPQAKKVNDLRITEVEGVGYKEVEEEMRELRLKNKRLLQQLEESRRQEEEVRGELEETRIRLLAVGVEAEEVGGLGAAQAYNQEITSLTRRRLNHAEHLLSGYEFMDLQLRWALI